MKLFAIYIGGEHPGANIEVRGFPSGSDSPFVSVQMNGNPIYPVGPSSTGGILRPDPTIGAINVNESSAHSRYDGLSLSLTRRMVKRELLDLT
mgnify:CR=1 FL=1